MKKKNFNFDITQIKTSEGIKLAPAQNEYTLNCYDIIFGGRNEENNQKSEHYDSENDEEDNIKGMWFVGAFSLASVGLALLMLVI